MWASCVRLLAKLLFIEASVSDAADQRSEVTYRPRKSFSGIDRHQRALFLRCNPVVICSVILANVAVGAIEELLVGVQLVAQE